jgi:hypothetical protein
MMTGDIEAHRRGGKEQRDNTDKANRVLRPATLTKEVVAAVTRGAAGA